MEYRYIDIEAHIRTAQRLRSEALGDILATVWNKCAQWFGRLASHQLQPHGAVAKASASSVS